MRIAGKDSRFGLSMMMQMTPIKAEGQPETGARAPPLHRCPGPARIHRMGDSASGAADQSRTSR
jgi:hypothetical protein